MPVLHSSRCSAATATQFARAGRLWTLCTIEIEVAVRLGWSGMTLAIDGRADVQKGRDVLRGGGPVACVMPGVTEFVTLLPADFLTLRSD